jgi:hypothetical protein
MSRVSYQAMLEGAAAEAGDYVALPKEAVATRRKDAKRNVRVRVSDAQRRWLEEVTEMSGRGVDEGAILRALLATRSESDSPRSTERWQRRGRCPVSIVGHGFGKPLGA